jgi:FAD/FMN-containing dehydrogenase/Fe-S oxidoreductase
VNYTAPLPLSSHAKPVDTFPAARELEQELKRTVRGDVRFDRGSRALYATDASNYRQVPIGMVIPRDETDVIAAVAACRKFGAPILPRGAGTSLAGQCCNVAVVLDFTRHMDAILDLDAEQGFARVQPGAVLDTLRNRAEAHQLTFPPDPSTHNRCTIGGMIGNNSCGTHSLLGGKTVDNVDSLRLLLYDGTVLTAGATSKAQRQQILAEGGRRGEIYSELRRIGTQYAELIRTRYPKIPRRVSGYNLDELLPESNFNVARALVGTEGTCAIVLEAKLKLIHNPQHRTLLALGYHDAFAAADHVPEILEFKPIGLEGFEGSIVDGLRRKGSANLELLPDGNGFLLVEFGGDDAAETETRAASLMRRLQAASGEPSVRVYTNAEAKAVWQIREAGPRAAAFAPGAPTEWEGWDDAAVAPEKLGGYLRDIRKLMNEYEYRGAFYGHFGHGCVHMRVSFDLESERGIRKYGEFIERAADLVVSYGGSLSGEHGDGQSRAALLPKMFGPELVQAFREFKRAWDPQNKLNPNKVVDAHLPAENLRLGADYKPIRSKTHFQFPQDGGSLANATLRCIGLGACRKTDAGTMCPSYLATRQEEHSTRGRAHLLWEMLQGEVLRDGWKSEEVKEALDLCLSCKACKSECPANVDIATYKAEFLAHYYESKQYPLRAYAFGMIDRWARLASASPRVANFFTQTPAIKRVLQQILKVAKQREIPRLATVSFRRWAQKNRADMFLPTGNVSAQSPRVADVLLWVDTFNNYFCPEVCSAALAVLEREGLRVRVAAQDLCCGRPLYDFGMLERAKAYLQKVMDVLAGEIEAGTPIVVLEPSCASVFRDELQNLFPANERAQRLGRQTVLLSEFLADRTPGPPRHASAGHVFLHRHCHEKAVFKPTANPSAAEVLLRQAGFDICAPDTGCCGMAGPFGFEKEKFAISQAIAERVLLPAARNAATETLIIADGFSCREQIRQATGKRAMHLAEVLQPQGGGKQ